MSSRPSARRELRLRTADMHDRVDSVFSGTDLGTRDGYAAFLLAQAAAYLPVEAALTSAGAGRFLADWNHRQRSALLLHDLQQMDVPPPVSPPHVVTPTQAAVMGGVYVLEGSRLGGALLRRSVAPGFPAAFLSAGDPASWRRLIQIIDDRLVTTDEIAEAVDAARDVFSTFERSGRQFLKAN